MRKLLGLLVLLAVPAWGQNTETVPPQCTVAQLAAGTCAPAKLGTRVRISNGNAATGDSNCAVGTGPNAVLCEYDGSNWTSIDLLYGATSIGSDAELTVVEALANLAGVGGALEGVDIDAAIVACGTDRCQVNLQVGTYTDVCLQIGSHDEGLRIVGKGKGVTILNPPLDLDTCTGITTASAIIAIDDSDNVELDHFTIDGNKNSGGVTEVPTCAGTPGAIGGCGLGIRIANVSAQISHNISLHDLEIKELINDAIASREGEGISIVHNEMSSLGCHQTDSPCGCSGGASPGTCNGWDAHANLSSVTGFKSKGRGVGIDSDTQNSKVIDNAVTNTTYPGIEIFETDTNPWQGQTVIEDNEIIGNSITANGAINAAIRRNSVSSSGMSGVPGGANDLGTGIMVAANVSSNLIIEDNYIYDNDSAGMVVKGITGTNVIVRGNTLDNNCVVRVAGAGGDLIVRTTAATPFRDATIESNVVTDSNCTFDMTVDDEGGGAVGEVEGATRVIGGSFEGNVRLGNAGMIVQGLEVTGTLTYTANASGLAMNNTAGTTTYTAGNNMMILDGASLDFGSAGVRVTNDGDGAITLLGRGNGSDEDITLNLDDTSNTAVLSSSTGLATLSTMFSGIIYDTTIIQRSNEDFLIDLDNDNNGSNVFLIRDGADTHLVSVDESGTWSASGSLNLVSGVNLTSSGDGDLIILGTGNGTDEDLKLDLDNTANTVAVSSSTGVERITFGTIAVSLPRFTAFPGAPTQGDLLIITDDSVAGACDSVGGGATAVSLCFWNGAAWVNGAGL